MITSCRSCGSDDLHIILDLGSHPIANALVSDLDRPEDKYPLKVAFCAECAMLQVTETVAPEVLYRQDYPYFSSVSWPESEDYVDALIRKYGLGARSLVVEVASNDGYLLRHLVKRRIPCLGIDPAAGPVAAAHSIGVPTIWDYFGFRCAGQLAGSGMFADVVIANNVIAHVGDINDFVAGIARILKPEGVAIFEFSYAVDMIEKCAFDLIYHEHVFYHTLRGLMPLFERHGLYFNDVEHLAAQGGSLRLTVSRLSQPRSDSLEALFFKEAYRGVDNLPYYQAFGDRVLELRSALTDLLVAEKANGKRIACYGAAAKGSTLLNYLDLGEGFFKFVVDATPSKQCKYTPGQRIPIFHPGHLLSAQPDDVLLLAWNFADEIIAKESVYLDRGGQFIVPIPNPRIMSNQRSAA